MFLTVPHTSEEDRGPTSLELDSITDERLLFTLPVPSSMASQSQRNSLSDTSGSPEECSLKAPAFISQDLRVLRSSGS